MNAIIIIASNTFRETLRNKVLYNILLVAGAVLFLSFSFGDLSVFSRIQVMNDFGLATMSVTGLLLAIFIGVGMLGGEISSRTVYGVLARPVNRASFILGKFTGLMLTLFLNFFLIALLFFTAIFLMGGRPEGNLIAAILLIAVELGVVVAASMFFSTFTTQTLAAILTIGFYVIGHLNYLMTNTITEQNRIVEVIQKVLYYLLPNLSHFNIRSEVVYSVAQPQGFVPLALLYGFLYITVLLFLSMAVFSRKDL